jgi:Kdo2-lipid IVA lauroyltransferase/acyltransferase
MSPSAGARSPVEVPPFRKPADRRGAWFEFMALRFVQRTLGVLPRPVQIPVLGGLARFARALDGRHAGPAREFLRIALPDASEDQLDWHVLESYRHLARVAVESERLPSLRGARLGDHYDVEVCPGLEELVASRRGCLVLTAHVGLWEGIGLPLHALGFPFGAAVGKPPKNQHLARWLQRSAEAQGYQLLARAGAMKSVPRIVRAGGAAVLLLDQRPRVKAIQATFFGRLANCDRSAGVLVRRVAAPILVMGCYLIPGSRRYRLVFQRVVMPEELEGASPTEVMELVNRETEALILRAPEQYFWLHDRFKGAPEPSRAG